MHKNGIEVTDNIIDFENTRENDSTLTSCLELVYDAKLISKGEWQTANLCRKYLQVINILDVATGEGKYVSYDYWKGNKNGNRLRNIVWPNQGKPKPSDWIAWRRVLR